MPNYTVSASELTESATILIRGTLGFARLTRLIDGEELAKSDQRRVQNGMSPVGRPHVTATLTHSEVVFADPANPTTEERFVDERRFASKKNPETGPNYSIDSKGNSLPIIAIPSEKGDGTFDQDTSGRELAQGLDVTFVLRVYKPKNFANRGLALDQVVVNEAPRYYGSGTTDTKELAARGIVFNAPPVPVAAAGALTTGEAPELPTDDSEGLPLPGPVPATAYSATPAQAVAPAVPAQQAAPAPAPAAVAVLEETLEQKLARLEALDAANGGNQGNGSAVGASPWGGQQVVPGITYQG